MSLHTQTEGVGRDLVLVHGWGLGSSVWSETAQALAQNFRVTRIDLPGYGQSAMLNNNSLATLTELALNAAPARAIWMGWSLGGLVAMQAALSQAQRISGLILIASTPRFMRSADWQAGVDAQILEKFTHDLEADYASTIKRFLALQTRGSERAQNALRRLNAQLRTHGQPAADTLRNGLAILRDTDLRAQLMRIICPVLIIAGRHDTLVPPAAAERLAIMLKSAQLRIIPGAGHAPFISHPQEFLLAVNEFINEQSPTDSYAGAASAR